MPVKICIIQALTFNNDYQWSCRESNPGPNILAVSLLHVYFCIDCRERAGAKQTNFFLRRIVLSPDYFISGQQPVLFLSRRKSVATGLASYNGPNGYESIDYAAMAYEVLPFKVFVFIFKC